MSCNRMLNMSEIIIYLLSVSYKIYKTINKIYYFCIFIFTNIYTFIQYYRLSRFKLELPLIKSNLLRKTIDNFLIFKLMEMQLNPILIYF